MRERLLQQLLGEAVHDAAAVHRAVRRTRLIVHLVERQRFRVGCNKEMEYILLHWFEVKSSVRTKCHLTF